MTTVGRWPVLGFIYIFHQSLSSSGQIKQYVRSTIFLMNVQFLLNHTIIRFEEEKRMELFSWYVLDRLSDIPISCLLSY